MQISVSNSHKIYNLSVGKSLPEWISDKKRRKLEQKDINIRRRIQLVQNCDMPSLSHTVNFSPDGRYLFATGTYKPRVKCFELEDLSLKFERGLDADVIKLICLSDDFTKFVLLENDRYVEFHVKAGRHFRLRVPHFSRDMAFCKEASELYITGCHNEIFRLDLQRGQFLQPLKSAAASLTCCEFQDDHQLFVNGTTDCRVEAWDHRTPKKVAILDCVLNNAIALGIDANFLPEVTSLKFKDSLHLGVGLSSGQVLLYDIRSSKPYFIKDHQMGLPIKKLDFDNENELVLSMDSRILKIWNEINGKPFAAVEPEAELNDFCRYPNSGLIFFANDTTKILQYFVPSLGPAPKWCSYLESITEELEEVEQPAVYDDYKFVTKSQLEEVGLTHLIGTSMLRAYMHGYFIDMRYYEKARSLTQPMAFENYKKRKLQEKMEEERESNFIRTKMHTKLPKVNKELASKLQSELSIQGGKKKSKEAASKLLSDNRFKAMFEDADFEMDIESEQFKNTVPGSKTNHQKDSDEESD